jgi:hypothetical protein
VSRLNAASFSWRVIVSVEVKVEVRGEPGLALPDSGCRDAKINGGLCHGMQECFGAVNGPPPSVGAQYWPSEKSSGRWALATPRRAARPLSRLLWFEL